MACFLPHPNLETKMTSTPPVSGLVLEEASTDKRTTKLQSFHTSPLCGHGTRPQTCAALSKERLPLLKEVGDSPFPAIFSNSCPAEESVLRFVCFVRGSQTEVATL